MLSKNAVGIVLLFLSFIGVEVSETQVTDFIVAVTTIIGFVMMIYNQIFREDVENFFFKKKKDVE